MQRGSVIGSETEVGRAVSARAVDCAGARIAAGLTWFPLDDDQAVLGQREVDGAVLLVHDEEFSRRVGFGLRPERSIVAAVVIVGCFPRRAIAACAAHSRVSEGAEYPQRQNSSLQSAADSWSPIPALAHPTRVCTRVYTP